MFRKEGNLFIDVYEALLGKPAHKFIAVPNILIQEADKKYFDPLFFPLGVCLKYTCIFYNVKLSLDIPLVGNGV